MVRLSTTWSEFPAQWPALLGEVWGVVRTDGRNVMLYADDVPNVEVGVELTGEFQPSGRVVGSELPGGEVATTFAAGPPTPEGLRAGHRAVVDWCAEHGHELTGVRWEIYSHQRPDVEVGTDLCWQLA